MQLSILMLQIMVIIALSRAMGLIFARLRLPQVIGEMIAGIMLGPSLLGHFWPDAAATLFPKDSIQYLNAIANIGIVLFLFIIGLDFDPNLIRRRAKSAAVISAASIALPFVLGFSITYPMRSLFDVQHQQYLLPTALFMGAAISVTAFPVLARILTERNLNRTPMGAIAITCAAVNDVLAWLMLAVVVAIVKQDTQGVSLPVRIALIGAYLAIMLFSVRPLLRQVEKIYSTRGKLTHSMAAVVFLVLLGSAITTELIGVHALFGAFVAGLIMPRKDSFVRELTNRMEDFVTVFMLPIFFAYAGIRMNLFEIAHGNYIFYTLVIISIACFGKIVGAGGAAYLCGQSKRDSMAIGVLMNTRGLMELIILTVGLQLGVINQTIYGMMVIMALVTTGMTVPLLWFLHRGGVPDAVRSREDDKIFSILIPVARPESGGALLEIASYIATDKNKRFVALHLDRMTGAESYRGQVGDEAIAAHNVLLSPLIEESKRLNITIETQSYFSRDISTDIARVARSINSDLVIVGQHTPIFGNALLGGVVHRVMTSAESDVAVFFNRGFVKPQKILVPFLNSTHDRLALTIAGRIAKSTGAAISIVHVTTKAHPLKPSQTEVVKSFQDPTQAQSVNVKVVHDENPADAVLRESVGHDLIVIGVAEEWGLESSLIGLKAERIADESAASLLIVRRFIAEKQA